MLLIALLLALPLSYAVQDEWDIAATKIKHVSPLNFAKVPAYIREEFYDMGCMIPQIPDYWPGEKPHNIISGEFAYAGQKDWAAVCSRGGKSTIVVIWGNTFRENCPSPIGKPVSNKGFLQGSRNDIIFSRLISAFPADIKALYKMDAGLPSKRTHDAIDDYFLDKASTAVYCHDGKWIEFGTSD